MEVPGDGNCLVWSIRMMELGFTYTKSCGEEAANQEQCQIRHILKNMWVALSQESGDSPLGKLWRGFFLEYNDDFIRSFELKKQKMKQEIRAPPKKPKKPAAVEHVDLLTPPQVELPEEMKRRKEVARVGDAKPVPTCRPPSRERVEFKAPSARPAFAEPPVPDLEEKVDQALRKGSGGAGGLEGITAEELDRFDEEEEVDEGRRKRKRHHHRSCRAKTPSERERQLEVVGAWLASKSLAYLDFMRVHRRAAALKKSGVCFDGGYLQFKQRLISNQPPKCVVCQRIMAGFNVSMEDLQSLLRDDSNVSLNSNRSEPEPAQNQDGQAQASDPNHGDVEDYGVVEAGRVMEYIRSHEPIIVPIEKGDKLFYKCCVCKTKSYPEGKINHIGKPTLKNARHFIEQHIGCPSHMKKAKLAMQAKKKAEATVSSVPCAGYIVSSDNVVGSLSLFSRMSSACGPPTPS